MVTFLLFLSFLLNIISLLAIVILYLRQNRFVHMERDQKKTVAEMEDIISAYLLQMKEDHEEFIRTFESKVHAPEKEHIHPGGNDPAPDMFPKRPAAGFKAATKAYQESSDLKPRTNQSKDQDEPPSEHDPFLKEVISLKEKGMSIEEIAQTVGKGKTEIELLLKFRQIM
ncbi:hypothetical protein [Bacillus sp. KH172YL63]|uniref:hypothetical protein n=1 Tax=Bacillus sp. KH172YL63 TaxID=2709784 RepID=UPI0013E471A6|nr:hypothetical protein [Bacillus sp. KH172YL63]BCB03381.1 swarming motility protein SwrB [Bacillus sp. KH172YL63]